MAVPAYTNDLTDWIADGDTTAWGELNGAISGGAPDEVDTESALQGTNTVSQSTNTTSLCSMVRILGASVTLTTDQVFLVWHGHGVATALLNYASGGLRLAVATTLADWKAWAVGGNDVPPFPYGKWVNNPVDPTIAGEYTNGTPPAGLTFFGVGSMCILSQAVAKGQPHVCDIIRYGRAQSRFTGGETSNYCNFSGFSTLNDASSARWGLIQSTAGGYLWKGLMKIGLSTINTTNRARTTNVATLTTSGAHGLRVGDIVVISGLGGTGYNATATVATTPTTTTFTYANTGTNEGTTADTNGRINGIADFRDSNTSIFIQDTRKVYAAFNKIEISNTGTTVIWTGINFVNTSPSTNASDGSLEVVDNATVTFTSCNFTDMSTFIYKSNSTNTSSIYRRCGLITQNSSVFTECIFDSTTDATKAIASNNPTLISFCSFISSGTKHGIEIISAGTYTFAGNTFTGYGASGTTDAAIYNNSGGLVTLNITDGGGTPTIRNGVGASTVVNSNISITLTGLVNPSEVRVFNANTTTEIIGQENVTSGSFIFSVPSGTLLDITILALTYQNIRIKGYSSTSNTTLPIQQIIDRQYLNP